jgi:hypothetical protein
VHPKNEAKTSKETEKLVEIRIIFFIEYTSPMFSTSFGILGKSLEEYFENTMALYETLFLIAADIWSRPENQENTMMLTIALGT